MDSFPKIGFYHVSSPPPQSNIPHPAAHIPWFSLGIIKVKLGTSNYRIPATPRYEFYRYEFYEHLLTFNNFPRPPIISARDQKQSQEREKKVEKRSAALVVLKLLSAHFRRKCKTIYTEKSQ